MTFGCNFGSHICSIYGLVANATLSGVLEHIHENWDIMTKDDCLPVHVALQLMDHSSLGRGGEYQDFKRTSKQLQNALKAIVNGMVAICISFQDADCSKSIIRGSIALSARFTKFNQAFKHHNIVFDR